MDKREGNTMTTLIEAAKGRGYSSDQILEAFARTLDGMMPDVSSEESKTKLSDNEFMIEVSKTLNNMGIPPKLKGYSYLKSAIILATKEPVMPEVTKVLYPDIAKQFGTKWKRVERAIRHAIEVAWDRGDVSILREYFGCTTRKPTNSDFIAIVAERFRLKYNIK